MTAAATSRRRYAGGGIPKLPAGAGTIALPGPDAATLLPSPRESYTRLLQQLGLAGEGGAGARTAPVPGQLRRVANFITFAFRNDLPTIDPADAAVIWEKWRVSVRDLRDLLRGADERAPATPAAAVLIDHRLWAVSEDLATALVEPHAVFERYCPWRSAWATYARLHPEAG